MTLTQVLVKLLVTGATILVIGLLCLFAVILLRRALRIHKDRSHTLRIKNEGNIPSLYFITVESPEPALEFQLSLNNVPLVGNPAASQPVVTALPPTSQSSTIKNSQAATPGINAGSAVQTGRAAASKLGAASGFLGALGNLLPGELGSNLRSKSAEVRNVQLETRQAVDAPVSMQRKVGELQNLSGTSGVNSQENTSAQAGSSFGNDGRTFSQHSAQRTMPAVNMSAKHPVYSFRTTEISPGASQSLALNIGTNKWRYPNGSFLYTVWSEQVPVEPINIQTPLVRKDGTVHFEKIDAWRYWLTPLASGAVIALSLLLVIISLAFIW